MVILNMKYITDIKEYFLTFPGPKSEPGVSDTLDCNELTLVWKELPLKGIF